MGIRKLYIIGCDNKYSIERHADGTIAKNGGVSYFQGSEAKTQKVVASTWEMNIAFEYAARYAQEHGIEIYNATRGGYLEAFPRINFDTLFE